MFNHKIPSYLVIVFIYLGFCSALPYYVMLASINFLENVVIPNSNFHWIFSIISFTTQIIVSGMIIYRENKLNTCYFTMIQYGLYISTLTCILLPIVFVMGIWSWLKLSLIFVLLVINSIGIAMNLNWLYAKVTMMVDTRYTLYVTFGNSLSGLLASCMNLYFHHVINSETQFIDDFDNNYVTNFLTYYICAFLLIIALVFLWMAKSDESIQECGGEESIYNSMVDPSKAQLNEEDIQDTSYFAKQLQRSRRNEYQSVNSESRIFVHSHTYNEADNKYWYMYIYLMGASYFAIFITYPGLITNYYFKYHDKYNWTFAFYAHFVLLVYSLFESLSSLAMIWHQLIIKHLLVLFCFRVVLNLAFFVMIYLNYMNVSVMLGVIIISGVIQGVTVPSIYVYGGKQWGLGVGGIIITFSAYVGIISGSLVSLVISKIIGIEPF